MVSEEEFNCGEGRARCRLIVVEGKRGVGLDRQRGNVASTAEGKGK